MRIPSLDGGGKLPEKFVPSRLSEAALSDAIATSPLATRVANVEAITGANLIANIFANQATAPVALMHRNARNLFPEQTLEGIAGAASLGVPGAIIDLDTNLLYGGGVGVMHDDTVDRTTTATGSTTAFTVPQWMTMSADAGNWFAPAWPNTLRLPLAGQVLDTYGGKVGLSLESKTTAVLGPLIKEITKRGLQKAVLINTKDLTHLPTIKAAGIHACYYFPGPAEAANATTRAAVLAAAPNSIVVQTGTAPTDLATIIGWGIPVLAGETDRRYEWNAFRAAGCHGLVANDPLYTLGLSPVRTTDSFASKTYDNGALPTATPTNRSTFMPFTGTNALRFVSGSTSGTTQLGIDLGFMGPTPSGNKTIEFYLTPSTLPTDTTRYFQFSVTDNDSILVYGASASVTHRGYLFNVRANGVLEFFRCDPGVGATLLGTKTTGVTPFTAGERRRFRATISATGVTWEDVTKAYAAPASNDTTHRYPWFLKFGRADTAATGTAVWDLDTVTVA